MCAGTRDADGVVAQGWDEDLPGVVGGWPGEGAGGLTGLEGGRRGREGAVVCGDGVLQERSGREASGDGTDLPPR